MHTMSPRRDGGNALIIALSVVLLMGALVTAQFSLVQKNSQQSSFFGGYENLRHYADSGIHLALHDLENGITANEGKIGTTSWTTVSDVGEDGYPGTLDPGEGDGIPTPGEPNLSPAPIGASESGISMIVWTEDSAWAGTKRIVSTAFNAEARVTVESFVKQSITSIPQTSAMYINPSVTLDLNGNKFSITGTDTNPDGTPGPEPATYGIATSVGDPPGSNAASIVSQIPANRYDQVTGLGANPSVGESSTTVDVHGTFADLKAIKDQSFAAGTYDDVIWGDPTNQKITYIAGSARLSGTGSGAGILLVDGDLEMTGEFDFQGLVIVRGDVRLAGGGNGTHIWGALWVTGYVALNEPDPEVTVVGNADLYFSSVTLDSVDTLIASSGGGGYSVVYWNQLK